MPTKPDQFTAQDFIKAIPGTGSIISAIADRVGCTWHTAKKYINDYPTVKQAYDAERNQVTDRARHNIIKAIQGGDLQMSKWWLQVMDEDFKPSANVDLTTKGEKLPALPDVIRVIVHSGGEPDDK